MAKDPAINWYFDNWTGGTRLMSRHQKGCYMDLLDAQFHSGPLSLEEVKTVLGPDFQACWPIISKKFIQQNGKFFNERMEAEKKKRAAYSESRSKNRKPKKDMLNISKSCDEDMKNTPGIETEIRTSTKEVGGLGEETRDGIVMYSPADFLKETSGSMWLEKVAMFTKTDLDACRTSLESFAGQQEVKSGYPRVLAKLKEHFVNWYKIESAKTNKPGKVKTAVDIFEKQKQEIAAKHGKFNDNGQ